MTREKLTRPVSPETDGHGWTFLNWALVFGLMLEPAINREDARRMLDAYERRLRQDFHHSRVEALLRTIDAAKRGAGLFGMPAAPKQGKPLARHKARR